MIIDTQDLAKVPGLLSATLTESAEGTSSLQLEFADWGPEWARYEEPLTLLHKGKPLWHGKLMPPVHSNVEKVRSTSVTAHNIFYVLEGVPLKEQINAVHRSFADSLYSSLGNVVGIIARSWESLARGLEVEAPGWGCRETGNGWEADANAKLRLDVSRARYALTPGISREGTITGWQILNRMRACNPDCVFRARPDGVIEVVSISEADRITWDADADPELVLEASGLAPRKEDRLEGVALTVSWREGTRGGVQVYKYPTNLDTNSSRVRLFSMNANSAAHAAKQFNTLSKQLRAYYEAVNMLQWSGTIVLELDKLAASPLACRVNIRGDGMHPDWATMDAIVTAVEWDLVDRTARLTLGASVQDPELWEVECPEVDDSGGGDPDQPGQPDPPVCDGCDCDGDDGDEEEEEDPPTTGGCGCAENWTVVAEFMDSTKEWFDHLERDHCCDTDFGEKYKNFEFPKFSEKIMAGADEAAAVAAADVAPLVSTYELAEKEIEDKA